MSDSQIPVEEMTPMNWAWLERMSRHAQERVPLAETDWLGIRNMEHHRQELVKECARLRAERESLRDKFIAAALMGLLSRIPYGQDWDCEDVAHGAINCADVMMKAREGK